MTDLFTNFSLTQIILCVLGIFILIDWFINFINKVKVELDKIINKKEQQDGLQKEVERRAEIQDNIQQSVKEIIKAVDTINNRIDTNTKKLNDVCESAQNMEDEIKSFSETDRAMIKAHISDKYKQATKENKISEYDLSICEKMYLCYKKAGGKQPFIDRMINDLRNLPN